MSCGIKGDEINYEIPTYDWTVLSIFYSSLDTPSSSIMATDVWRETDSMRMLCKEALLELLMRLFLIATRKWSVN